MRDINNKTKAKDHKPSLAGVPITLFPIPVVITEVKVAAGFIKPFGRLTVLPITIWTAKASPKARAIPKIKAVIIPPLA